MIVEDCMTKNPVTVDVSTPLADVAKQMRDKNVGSVVVLRDTKVAGIVTDRQVVTEGLASDTDAAATPVENIMTGPPARLHPDDSLFAAVDTLRSAGVVRRAVVVDETDRLVGIISISDIAVVTQRLLKAVMLEETHHALEEAYVLTGGKRITKHMRRPTKQERLPPDEPTHTTTEPTPMGPPTKRGNVPQTSDSR